MKGQLSIFDIIPDGKRRPCDYHFKRYIGQRVRLMFGSYFDHDVREGVIKEIIDHYFTLVRINGRDYIGTPYSLSEVIQ